MGKVQKMEKTAALMLFKKNAKTKQGGKMW